MQIDFENWILSQKIDETAKVLFSEAVTCYKMSTYRAALLLSYIGFQTILLERILTAKSPTSITPSQWQDIRNNLLNDDKWDAQVFETTQMGMPRSIFKLSDDLRNQVLYWKNRRNDCAHAKANEIIHAHVEAFWSFIRSNLAKFVVNGSREGLLNEVRIHFDRSLTPAGTDPLPILTRIPTAIEDNQMLAFLEEATDNLNDLLAQPQGIDDVIKFFIGIFHVGHDSMIKHVVTLLKSRLNLLKPILRTYPDKLQYFSGDPAFIRSLWYKHLFNSVHQNDMPVYCGLLRNNMIPVAELREAHQTVIERGVHVPLDEEVFEVLKNSTFFEHFRDYAFTQNNIHEFSWAKKAVDIVIYYLGKFKIDMEIAERLSSTFNYKAHPYSLADGINKFFRDNPSKKAECWQIMQENNILIPKYLNLKQSLDKDEESEW